MNETKEPEAPEADDPKDDQRVAIVLDTVDTWIRSLPNFAKSTEGVAEDMWWQVKGRLKEAGLV